MNRFIDKTAVLVLCMISLCMGGDYISVVITLLLSISVSTLIQMFTGKGTAKVLLAAWAFSCAIFPTMLCMLPLILYDSLREKRWYYSFASLTFVLIPLELTVAQYMTVLAGVVVTLVFYIRLSRQEVVSQRMKELRDAGTEKNIRLSEQNIRLAEAQDNMIYVATLRERNRIAREIHDNVGHMLTRSLLQSGAIMIINKDENLKEPLESLKNTLDSAMTSIRESVHDLHDESIDLKKVIADSISSINDRFKVDMEYDMSDEVPGNIKLCIAGIIKESFSNAVKHSDGDNIDLKVVEHPAFYQLVIMDNGHPSEIHQTGIGLQNMEDRVRGAGGTINFTPSDKGFRIFVSIPKK